MSETAKQLQAPYTVERKPGVPPAVWIMDVSGYRVAAMAYMGANHQDAQIAHAEAIVHALNCHDSLVEACHMALEAVDLMAHAHANSSEFKQYSNRWKFRARDIRAAIAKAEPAEGKG